MDILQFALGVSYAYITIKLFSYIDSQYKLLQMRRRKTQSLVIGTDYKTPKRE